MTPTAIKLAGEALFIPELGVQQVINPCYKNTNRTEQKRQPAGQICPQTSHHLESLKEKFSWMTSAKVTYELPRRASLTGIPRFALKTGISSQFSSCPHSLIADSRSQRDHDSHRLYSRWSRVLLFAPWHLFHPTNDTFHSGNWNWSDLSWNSSC